MRFYFEIHERGDNSEKNDGSSTSNHAGTTHCLHLSVYGSISLFARSMCMYACVLYILLYRILYRQCMHVRFYYMG